MEIRFLRHFAFYCKYTSVISILCVYCYMVDSADKLTRHRHIHVCNDWHYDVPMAMTLLGDRKFSASL